MKKTRLVVALIAIGLLCGTLGWSLYRVSAMRKVLAETTERLSVADSLAQVADDARWYAERQRDKSDGILEDLKRAYPELKRRALEIEAERNVALENEIEARRQEQGKQVALEGERSARMDEAEQRVIAEARADSLTRAKRITDNLNLQQNSSRLAQNSMAVKGRPAFRGLMAVHALRCMEQAGGDVHKDELVRALSVGLEELERPDPVRLGGLKKSPNQLFVENGRNDLWILGHNGILLQTDKGLKHANTLTDLSSKIEPGTGRSYLSSDGKAIVLTNASGDIAVYSSTSGPLLAKSNSSSPCANPRAVASWPGTSQVVVGDASGNIQLWSKERDRFNPLTQLKAGGAIKGMTFDPASQKVVIIAATGPAWILAADGQYTEVPLPMGHLARCLAPADKGIVFIGTEKGAVLKLHISEGRATTVHEGGGRRVEQIAHSPSTGQIAFVDAVKELVIVNAGSTTRITLDAIPSAMAFGTGDVLYLAFGDRVERVFCSGRSMAERICELVDRTWSQAEWNEIGETGIPAPTCAGF